jgi:ankyrin repeat protein
MSARTGADINACNKRGENAIFIACYNGHVHVARLLLEHGAMPPASDQLIYTKEELTYTESMWVLESVRAEITHEEEWAKAEKAQVICAFLPLQVASIVPHILLHVLSQLVLI